MEQQQLCKDMLSKSMSAMFGKQQVHLETGMCMPGLCAMGSICLTLLCTWQGNRDDSMDPVLRKVQEVKFSALFDWQGTKPWGPQMLLQSRAVSLAPQAGQC